MGIIEAAYQWLSEPYSKKEIVVQLPDFTAEIAQIEHFAKLAVTEKRRFLEQSIHEAIQKAVDHLCVRLVFKTTDLTEALITSANGHNFVACAFATRGLLEHSGAIWYASNWLSLHANRVLPSQNIQEFLLGIDKFATGSHFNWEDALRRGELRKAIRERTWKKEKQWHGLSSGRFIETLDNISKARGKSIDEGEINAIYSMLSDVVHPAATLSVIYPGPQDGTYRFKGLTQSQIQLIGLLTILPAANALTLFRDGYEEVVKTSKDLTIQVKLVRS